MVESGPARARDRVLLLTTAHNEARFIDGLVDAVLGQSRRPDRWVIVDDGSTDATFAVLDRRVAGYEWITLVRREIVVPRPADRLAAGLVPRALNHALATLDWRRFTHIGKLDADVVLPACFLERLLASFAADPSLGMTGGVLTEAQRGGWQRVSQPDTHAPPPARLYSTRCFEACGGFRERLAWDTIDEVHARMLGYRTGVDRGLAVRHLRVRGTADGRLRGRARHGECAWIAQYPAWFVLVRSVKVGLTFRPRGVAALAFLWGYFGAPLRGVARVPDPRFRSFVRRELRARARRAGVR
jgi:poly-beta-1,6-N-acetyl-D-glucosamine synthase